MERLVPPVCDGDHAITFLFLAVLRAADTMQPKTGGGVVIGTLPEWSVP
jgi:hypothetical protein